MRIVAIVFSRGFSQQLENVISQQQNDEWNDDKGNTVTKLGLGKLMV